MDSQNCIAILKKLDLKFVTGVPCSFLKPFLSSLADEKEIKHVIATNEGEAVGIGTGYHLATGKVPILYMQNSGLGNTVNALTSLCAKTAYSIPLILFITWRGKPGTRDEPQHELMGQIMIKLLKTLHIPYEFASQNPLELYKRLTSLKKDARFHRHPVAMIFSTALFTSCQKEVKKQSLFPMSREEALSIILSLTKSGLVISTTGKTSRELFELRKRRNMSHKYDFLTIGSMGHAASVGLGVALHTKKNTYIIDGDGSILMKMGVLATIGYYQPKNLVHIIIDNESYESTGSQPSVSKKLIWKLILQGTGYKSVVVVSQETQLRDVDFKILEKPCAVIIKVHSGSRKDLGRPTSSPIKNKELFMKFIRGK